MVFKSELSIKLLTGFGFKIFQQPVGADLLYLHEKENSSHKDLIES